MRHFSGYFVALLRQGGISYISKLEYATYSKSRILEEFAKVWRVDTIEDESALKKRLPMLSVLLRRVRLFYPEA